MNLSRKLKPSPALPRPLPLRGALGLGAGVLMVHLWLLANSPLQLGPPASPDKGAAKIFHTRRIESPAPTAVAPETSPTARPRHAAATADRAARPEPPPPQPVPADESYAEPATLQASTPDATASSAADAASAETSTDTGSRAADASRVQLPGSAQLQFEGEGQVSGLHYAGSGVMSWQQDGQRYEAQLVISKVLLGAKVNLRTMHSKGDLGPQGIVPRRFSEKTRQERATHFQPEQGRIVFSSNAPEAPWQSGMQDRLSLNLQLAGMLAAEPERFATGTQVHVPTAGSREAGTWTFTVVGQPTLTLPAGEQPTIALRREPRRPYDQTIEIWFAPALGYLPARIRITEGNGNLVDLRLSAVTTP